jgi:glycosyltransferase involved in cell wall biosynthesis
MQRHIGLGDLNAAWRAYRAIAALKPDILHGHGAKGGFYARIFGTRMRLSGSKVVRLYSPHGGSLHYDADTLTGRLIFAIERLTERATDRILFVSEFERDTYREKIGEPRCSASVIYNGLRQGEFAPVEPARDAADFLYIGMMRDLKGPDLFIEALHRAGRLAGREANAVMVGDGDDIERYRVQAAGLGLGERIRFLPPMPARLAFALARTVVVPSRAEAMPYIVLEALAAGMPLISTSVGGIPEIFGDRRDVLCPPEAGAIAEAMAETLRDPAGYRSRMPDRALLQSRFLVEAMARKIEDAYREALAD